VEDKEIEKLYFTIGEVSELTGHAGSAIRFWCDELELKVYRNNKNERSFDVRMKDKIVRIAQLVDTGYYSMKGIRAIIEGKLYPFL